MKKLFFILLLIASLAGACKKYDEGPMFSLRSAYGRFANTHILVKYLVNGVDFLSLYNDSLSLEYQFKYHYDEYENMNTCLIGSFCKDTSWSELYWHWKLVNNKKNLKVFISNGTTTGTGPFGNHKLPEWEIIKLKYNDIRMKTNYNGKEYYIELKGN